MLRRSTKIQLILFVVVTLLGVSYVSAEYVGLGQNLFSSPCKMSADFPESGGIFSNAEVTYRGVTVGKVGQLHIIKKGVRVDLLLDNCSSPKIPTSSSATVADRSVVGEQYVNLVPKNGKGPYVSTSSHTVIPISRNAVPTPTKDLLVNLDNLFKSVPLNAVRTTVSELYLALNNRGPALGTLIDSNDLLLRAALEPQNVDNTIALIDNSPTVLGTQLDETQPLQSWTHSLRLLSGQLKKSDPDFRRLLNDGPSDLEEVHSFIRDNRTDIGVVLANVDTMNRIVVDHLGGVEEVLELYPALAAGGQSVLRVPKQAQLGLVLQSTPKPQDCGDPRKDSQGYNGVKRGPGDLSPEAPNVSAHCTAPVSSGTSVRGSANVPGGDPISDSGGGYAYPRVLTQNTIGTALLDPSKHSSDNSSMALLTDGLH